MSNSIYALKYMHFIWPLKSKTLKTSNEQHRLSAGFHALYLVARVNLSQPGKMNAYSFDKMPLDSKTETKLLSISLILRHLQQ